MSKFTAVAFSDHFHVNVQGQSVESSEYVLRNNVFLEGNIYNATCLTML